MPTRDFVLLKLCASKGLKITNHLLLKCFGSLLKFSSLLKDKETVLEALECLAFFLQRLSRSTRNKLREEHNNELQCLVKYMLQCGDYVTQERIAEILSRVAPSDKKQEAANIWFKSFSSETRKLFLDFGKTFFQIEVQEFLNSINTTFETGVNTFVCYKIIYQNKEVYRPDLYNHMHVNFSMRSKSIDFTVLLKEGHADDETNPLCCIEVPIKMVKEAVLMPSNKKGFHVLSMSVRIGAPETPCLEKQADLVMVLKDLDCEIVKMLLEDKLENDLSKISELTFEASQNALDVSKTVPYKIDRGSSRLLDIDGANTAIMKSKKVGRAEDSNNPKTFINDLVPNSPGGSTYADFKTVCGSDQEISDAEETKVQLPSKRKATPVVEQMSTDWSDNDDEPSNLHVNERKGIPVFQKQDNQVAPGLGKRIPNQKVTPAATRTFTRVATPAPPFQEKVKVGQKRKATPAINLLTTVDKIGSEDLNDVTNRSERKMDRLNKIPSTPAVNLKQSNQLMRNDKKIPVTKPRGRPKKTPIQQAITQKANKQSSSKASKDVPSKTEKSAPMVTSKGDDLRSSKRTEVAVSNEPTEKKKLGKSDVLKKQLFKDLPANLITSSSKPTVFDITKQYENNKKTKIAQAQNRKPIFPSSFNMGSYSKDSVFDEVLKTSYPDRENRSKVKPVQFVAPISDTSSVVPSKEKLATLDELLASEPKPPMRTTIKKRSTASIEKLFSGRKTPKSEDAQFSKITKMLSKGKPTNLKLPLSLSKDNVSSYTTHTKAVAATEAYGNFNRYDKKPQNSKNHLNNDIEIQLPAAAASNRDRGVGNIGKAPKHQLNKSSDTKDDDDCTVISVQNLKTIEDKVMKNSEILSYDFEDLYDTWEPIKESAKGQVRYSSTLKNDLQIMQNDLEMIIEKQKLDMAMTSNQSRIRKVLEKPQSPELEQWKASSIVDQKNAIPWGNLQGNPKKNNCSNKKSKQLDPKDNPNISKKNMLLHLLPKCSMQTADTNVKNLKEKIKHLYELYNQEEAQGNKISKLIILKKMVHQLKETVKVESSQLEIISHRHDLLEEVKEAFDEKFMDPMEITNKRPVITELADELLQLGAATIDEDAVIDKVDDLIAHALEISREGLRASIKKLIVDSWSVKD
ncbi:uncharacterized protein LOC132192505 isoform X2 [Neocloeon triangulifer]|nr:uncharacterized protein LOC132192505 isoform X2 [Neocloeon triangulifer]